MCVRVELQIKWFVADIGIVGAIVSARSRGRESLRGPGTKGSSRGPVMKSARREKKKTRNEAESSWA